MQFHVAHPVALEGDAHEPVDEAEGRAQDDEHDPEPEEQVDALVEEVDRQHALHGVPVDVVAELPHLEVAHRDAGEARRLRPLLVLGQVPQHGDAVPVEVGRQEEVHEDQLQQRVAEVDEFRHHVQHRQVVAVLLAAHHPTARLQDVLDAGEPAALLVAVVAEVAVDAPSHRLQRGRPLLRLV